MRWLSFTSLIVLAALSGCGGSSAGLPVMGEVKLDGQPLAWGQIYLHGEIDKSSNTNHAIYEIRDGSFGSDGGGLPAGSYSVSILVHDGAAPPPVDPAAVEASPPEPKFVGQWEGTADVQQEIPLSFELRKSELKLPEGTAARRAPGV